MNIKLNGTEKKLDTSVINISGLLQTQEVKHPNRMVVQHNGKVVKKELYDTIFIKENDVVNFLYLVGGGNL